MFSRAKPSPPVPNHGPGAERDPAVLEERRRGIVAEPELAAVEPGEEAGLGHGVARRPAARARAATRAGGGSGRGGRAARRATARPRRTPRSRRARRSDPRGTGRAGGSLPRERGALLGARDDHRRLEAGDVPGLARAREREPVGGGLLAHRRGRARASRRRAPAARGSRRRARSRRGASRARRSRPAPRACGRGPSGCAGCRAGRPRAVGERALERVEVEPPDAVVAEGERRLDDPAPGRDDRHEERPVDGRVDHDAVVRARSARRAAPRSRSRRRERARRARARPSSRSARPRSRRRPRRGASGCG